MTDRPPPATEANDRALLPLLNELARLEDLLEEMTDLDVSSRAEVEIRLAALNREIDVRSDA